MVQVQTLDPWLDLYISTGLSACSALRSTMALVARMIPQLEGVIALVERM